MLTRVALGAITAMAGPAIASLTGDYFAARDRGRVYAYIVGGEVAGSAAGFAVGGSVAAILTWRAAFLLLALPGFFLARTLWRTIPEPRRGGRSRLGPFGGAPETDETARRRGVAPDPRLVLTEDAHRMGFVRAVRYTLRVPSNRLLIAGSALGYFYFAGLQSFALLFVRGRYHAGQATAELVLLVLVVGAVLGTLVGGRLTDALLRRGVLEARVTVPAVCYLGSAAVLLPGLLGTHLTPALWFDAAGAALMSAAIPGLDAARLDVMPEGLWGRAESVRTLLRSIGQALAPLAFGATSSLVAGIAPEQAPVGTHPPISPGAARGLEVAFLLMLGALVAAGVMLWRSRSSYRRDAATAAASARASVTHSV
jgi:MFS family permease